MIGPKNADHATLVDCNAWIDCIAGSIVGGMRRAPMCAKVVGYLHKYPPAAGPKPFVCKVQTLLLRVGRAAECNRPLEVGKTVAIQRLPFVSVHRCNHGWQRSRRSVTIEARQRIYRPKSPIRRAAILRVKRTDAGFTQVDGALQIHRVAAVAWTG